MQKKKYLPLRVGPGEFHENDYLCSRFIRNDDNHDALVLLFPTGLINSGYHH